MAKEREYEVVFKGPDGKLQYVRVPASSQEQAEQRAMRHQFRRQARTDLTFARLNADLENLKATDTLGQARAKYEIERRKADLGRYDSDLMFKPHSITERGGS